MIRVWLPHHLRTLAGLEGPEVRLEVAGPATLDGVLAALEARHPVLRGTIRDAQTQQRRPMVRYFACEVDWSFEPGDKPLPAEVAGGLEPLLIVGAISGG
ncbi:MAG: MoaD/ThiS family protein [Meiothermus sp.]|nr:MoaD/ThiS family protein [Meiothermus sp.]